MNKAVVIGCYEYHLLNGKLYITSEDNPDTQVVLGSEAVKALVDYINGISQEDEPDEARALVQYILN